MPWSTAGGLAALCLASLAPGTALGVVSSISDRGYPYLFFSDPAVPVVWHRGALALQFASSDAVRINGRGVRFIHGGNSALALRRHGGDTGSSGGISDLPAAPLQLIVPQGGIPNSNGWSHVGCTGPTQKGGLCTVRGDGFVESRVFPIPGIGVSVAQGAPSAVSEAFARPCPESNTGRNLVGWADNNGIIPWDVSACNVLGAGGDYVFAPHAEGGGVLYVLQDPISFQVVVVMGILAVILAIALSRNMEFALGTSETPTRTATSLGCMTVLLFLTLFATGRADVLEPYVTREDRLACVAITTYVCYYILRIGVPSLARWASAHAPGVELGGFNASPVNPILGTLSLAALRLYSTLDNPYTTGILFLVGTRLIQKVAWFFAPCPVAAAVVKTHQDRGLDQLFRLADVAADTAMVAVYIYAGFVPQVVAGGDSHIAALGAVQGVYAGLTLVMAMESCGLGTSSDRAEKKN